MSKRGYYVEWTTKFNTRQKGVVYHEDQLKEFVAAKKLFIRLVNDKFEVMGDKHVIKSPLIVKFDIIGFVD